MKFDYECDNPDGLVIIDEAYLDELSNSELLYALDILLDKKGETELIYDFPGENWSEVWERETQQLRDFCNQGKMIIYLLEDDIKGCEVVEEENQSTSMLNASSGNIMIVSAGEIIQCLAYPDVEIEKVLEVNLNPGKYLFKCDDMKRILYCKTDIDIEGLENIIEF